MPTTDRGVRSETVHKPQRFFLHTNNKLLHCCSSTALKHYLPVFDTPQGGKYKFQELRYCERRQIGRERALRRARRKRTSTPTRRDNMASEGQSPSRGSTPSIPLKRPLEDDHAPTISSPLNPNPPARSSAAPVREQRSKKDSLKKREASESTARPSATDKSGKGKKKGPEDEPLALSPLRYNHSLPTQAWQYSNKELSYVPHEAEPVLAPDRTELLKPVDQYAFASGWRPAHS